MKIYQTERKRDMSVKCASIRKNKVLKKLPLLRKKRLVKRDQQQHLLLKKKQRLLHQLKKNQIKDLRLLPKKKQRWWPSQPKRSLQQRKRKQLQLLPQSKNLNKLPYQCLHQRPLIQVKYPLKSRLNHLKLLLLHQRQKKKRNRKIMRKLRKMKKRKMALRLRKKMMKNMVKMMHECHENVMEQYLMIIEGHYCIEHLLNFE